MDGITIHPRYVGGHDPMDICRGHSWVDVDCVGGGNMMKNEWIWDLIGITLMVLIMLWWAS